jgi:hypothetical protein
LKLDLWEPNARGMDDVYELIEPFCSVEKDVMLELLSERGK